MLSEESFFALSQMRCSLASYQFNFWKL